MNNDSRRNPFPRCIWPKCPDYQYHDLKLCVTHITIVAYQGKKYLPVMMRLADLEAHDRETAYHAEQEVKAVTREERRAQPVTIYALQGGFNVKIGYTSKPLQERLRSYPPNHTLLVAYTATRAEETRLKRKFAHLRTHGKEWFPYAPEVVEWVEQSIAEHGAPDPTITCGPAKATVRRPHAQKAALRPRHTAWHVA